MVSTARSLAYELLCIRLVSFAHWCSLCCWGAVAWVGHGSTWQLQCPHHLLLIADNQEDHIQWYHQKLHGVLTVWVHKTCSRKTKRGVHHLKYIWATCNGHSHPIHGPTVTEGRWIGCGWHHAWCGRHFLVAWWYAVVRWGFWQCHECEMFCGLGNVHKTLTCMLPAIPATSLLSIFIIMVKVSHYAAWRTDGYSPCP